MGCEGGIPAVARVPIVEARARIVTDIHASLCLEERLPPQQPVTPDHAVLEIILEQDGFALAIADDVLSRRAGNGPQPSRCAPLETAPTCFRLGAHRLLAAIQYG